jgi:allantoin racemase
MTLSMQTSIDTNASPASDAADSRINCRFDKGKAMNPIDARRKFLLGASTAGLVGLLPSRAAVAQGAPAVRRRLRILVLNPNTSTDFTKVITREARRVGAPDTDFVEATAPVGPRFIGTRTTIAVAEYGITEALARILAKDRQYDAAIVAGFGEPVGALREFAPFPVVAMLEASVVAAMQLGNKFSVLTGGAQWLPMLEEQIRVLGLLHRVASIRAIPLTGPEIVANQDRAMSLLAELSEACVRENGAECVILGGGAVAGIAPQIQDRVSVPLLDSVGVSVATAEMLARITTIPKGRKRPPSAESDGLSAELRDLLKNP